MLCFYELNVHVAQSGNSGIWPRLDTVLLNVFLVIFICLLSCFIGRGLAETWEGRHGNRTVGYGQFTYLEHGLDCVVCCKSAEYVFGFMKLM